MKGQRNKMKIHVRSATLLIFIWAGLSGCGGEKEDQSKVPIDVKKAEMADSTRLDSAPDSTGLLDSLTGEDNKQERKLRFR